MTGIPLKPGYYWAKWRIAADNTHEGDELTPSDAWEIVQVNVNDMFEEDPNVPDALSVSVPGVRETQWRDCFVWGDFVGELAPHGACKPGASGTPVAAEADKRLSLPSDMTPAIEDALSFMLWHSGSLAAAYRKAGFKIPPKAEKEQAFVLWKNLHFAIKHGDEWRKEAQAELNALRDRAAAPSIGSEGV